MPRPPRVDYEGAWHHIVNRGAGKAHVFSAPGDSRLFLDCVASASQRYGLEVHAYCLMGNHFNLLVLSKQGQLSSAMRFASGRFTKLKNASERNDGPIFRSRFFSKEIRKNPHIAQTSRYIHLNPVLAGMARSPELWPWSSASAYVECSPKPSFLSTNFILDMLGPTESEAHYRRFLDDGVDADTLRGNAQLDGRVMVSDPEGLTPRTAGLMEEVSDPEGPTPGGGGARGSGLGPSGSDTGTGAPQ